MFKDGGEGGVIGGEHANTRLAVEFKFEELNTFFKTVTVGRTGGFLGGRGGGKGMGWFLANRLMRRKKLEGLFGPLLDLKVNRARYNWFFLALLFV